MTKISIVIPARNEAEHLPNLLRSLRLYLRNEAEVLVVDNGSSDETATIGREYGYRVHQTSTTFYPSVARNLGANLVQGEVLVFLDADVIVTETWAERLRQIASDPNFLAGDALIGESYHMSVKPSWIEQYWFEPLRKKEKQYINGGNIIISRRAFKRLSGFDPQLETGEDVDFSNRAKALGIQVVFDPALVVHHEGFPRDLRSFFRREKWHGKGDFSRLSFFRRSRVAQIAVLFGILYAANLLLLPVSLHYSPVVFGALLGLSSLFILILCMIPSVIKFRNFGVRHLLMGIFIYFIYFNARLASLFASDYSLASVEAMPEPAGKNG